MSGFGGKVAIVTGAGSGLGEAIGKALAAKGTKVALYDIRREAAERVAAEIAKAGETSVEPASDRARGPDGTPCDSSLSLTWSAGRTPDRLGR